MKKINKIFLSIIFSIIYFLINFQSVSADLWIIPSSDSDLWSSCKWLTEAFSSWEFSFDLIWCYILFLIDIFSQVAVMISFVFVLIWSFRYTITYLEGDENWDNAKKTIKNALLWLAISTLAYVIVDVFIRFLL